MSNWRKKQIVKKISKILFCHSFCQFRTDNHWTPCRACELWVELFHVCKWVSVFSIVSTCHLNVEHMKPKMTKLVWPFHWYKRLIGQYIVFIATKLIQLWIIYKSFLKRFIFRFISHEYLLVVLGVNFFCLYLINTI